MLNYTATTNESKKITAIVKRVRELGWDFEPLDLEMDLMVCNNHGNPLDFEKLLAFNDADFAHDIFGIYNRLDRTSGELGNCFVPRCSAPEVAI